MSTLSNRLIVMVLDEVLDVVSKRIVVNSQSNELRGLTL